MEDKINVARVNPLVLFRSLFFQDDRQVYILSIMKLKSLLLGRPWSIGKPKYFPREVVL